MKSSFEDLLQRYLTGQVSDPEKVKIETWLEIMTAAKPGDAELSKVEEERLFQRIVAGKNNIDDLHAIVPVKGGTLLPGWILRIAATLSIIAMVAYAGWRTGETSDGRLVLSSSGPVEKVKLTDGSLVWLKGNSELRYHRNEEKNIRYVALKGEALFEVAPDASVPFVVDCGPVMIRVVGTSFNVLTNGDSVALRVLTGKVNLSLEVDSRGVEAAAGEKVVYAVKGGIRKLPLSIGEVAAVTSGTTYNMQFSNASLSDVFHRLQEKFGVQITIEGKNVGACRITANLTGQPLERSLVLIAEVLDVTYQRKADTVIVTGDGCQ